MKAKVFRFLAKQGQHDHIARLLTAEYGKPKMAPYDGPRGKGVMITLNLPADISKRDVDRSLYRQGVLGAVSRRNRFLIVKWPGWVSYDLLDKVGNKPFILAIGRKLRKAIVYVRTYCDCCGTITELEYLDKK